MWSTVSENIRLSCHFNTFLTFFKLTFIFTDFLFVVRRWPHIFLLGSLRKQRSILFHLTREDLRRATKEWRGFISYADHSDGKQLTKTFIAKNLRLNTTQTAQHSKFLTFINFFNFSQLFRDHRATQHITDWSRLSIANLNESLTLQFPMKMLTFKFF